MPAAEMLTVIALMSPMTFFIVLPRIPASAGRGGTTTTCHQGGIILRSYRYRADGGELPATLRRSSQEAQDTFTEAHDDAVRTYGEGDYADRAAFVALKKKFEKCGDHWIAKEQPAN